MNETTLDHSSHREFLAYYASRSESPRELDHCRSIRRTILGVLGRRDGASGKYEILDIGCAAGTQSIIWAELGHGVHGLDINGPLLDLAKQRAATAGYDIDFCLGSAAKLPWPDNSMDVCLALELLEHVPDWSRCLNECTRVLRPGGILYLSTTNKLCPKQEEFNLTGYSWYPARLKKHIERLALSTRPELANYATYPAVNWFTPYSLRAELARRGFSSLDRFDLIDTSEKGKFAKFIVASINRLSLLRLLAFFATPSTALLGIKEGSVR